MAPWVSEKTDADIGTVPEPSVSLFPVVAVWLGPVPLDDRIVEDPGRDVEESEAPSPRSELV